MTAMCFALTPTDRLAKVVPPRVITWRESSYPLAAMTVLPQLTNSQKSSLAVV